MKKGGEIMRMRLNEATLEEVKALYCFWEKKGYVTLIDYDKENLYMVVSKK